MQLARNSASPNLVPPTEFESIEKEHMKLRHCVAVVIAGWALGAQLAQAQNYYEVARIITTRVPAYQVKGTPVSVTLRLSGSFQLGAPGMVYLQPGLMWVTEAAPLFHVFDEGNQNPGPAPDPGPTPPPRPDVTWLTNYSMMLPGGVDADYYTMDSWLRDQLLSDPYPYENYTDGVFSYDLFLYNWHWDYYRADGRWLVLIADYGEDCEILVLYDAQ